MIKLTGLLGIFVLIPDCIFITESYSPIVLTHKAQRLRVETGNWALHTKFEEWRGVVTPTYYFHKFGALPFRLLLEPICFFVALYASFVFGIFFASLAAFPILFEETRGWNKLIGSLPFLALLVGILLGSIVVGLNQLFYNTRYRLAGDKIVPEARLPSMMLGSIFFAGGLFILAWTAEKRFPWIASLVGITLMGFGFFTIFQSALNYLVDTFQQYSASAIAANTFLRCTFAAAFPLFISPMYHGLGNGWAISCFAFVAALLIPIPFVFWVWGPSIRARGSHSTRG